LSEAKHEEEDMPSVHTSSYALLRCTKDREKEKDRDEKKEKKRGEGERESGGKLFCKRRQSADRREYIQDVRGHLKINIRAPHLTTSA